MYVLLSPRSVVVLQEHGAVDVVLRASFGRDDTEAFAGARLVQRRNILVLAYDDDFKFAKAVKKAAAKASATDEL